MSTMAIAEALEIAPGTVMSRLARARDALKQVMNPAPPVDSSNKITTLLRSKDG